MKNQHNHFISSDGSHGSIDNGIILFSWDNVPSDLYEKVEQALDYGYEDVMSLFDEEAIPYTIISERSISYINQ